MGKNVRVRSGERSRPSDTSTQWSEQLAGIKGRYERPEMRFTRENYSAGNQGVIKLRDLLLEDLELS